jgi:Immunity protein Imm1
VQPIAVRLRASRRRLVAESERELHEAIAAADREADETGKLAIVDFQAANGNMLSVIVGSAETALSFRFAGDVEPRFLSRGADSSNDPGIVFSRAAGNEIECPRWAVISRSDGLSALDEFAASNELPQRIEWAPFK